MALLGHLCDKIAQMVDYSILKFPFDSIHINSQFLWIFLAVFFIVYLILSSVLIYHWRIYGMNTKAVYLAQAVFLIASALLFISAIVSIGTF